MSRPLRIDYPNAWHHVMNRARRGTDLFLDKADYRQFIDLIQEAVELFNVNVAAYCLMPNHYHLMVQTPAANLSCCMRHINGIYTQKFNVSHGFDGTLFRGRYKSILVDADSYVLQLVAEVMDMTPGQVTAFGKSPQTVKARSLLCFWAHRRLGMGTVEIARKLG